MNPGRTGVASALRVGPGRCRGDRHCLQQAGQRTIVLDDGALRQHEADRNVALTDGVEARLDQLLDGGRTQQRDERARLGVGSASSGARCRRADNGLLYRRRLHLRKKVGHQTTKCKHDFSSKDKCSVRPKKLRLIQGGTNALAVGGTSNVAPHSGFNCF